MGIEEICTEARNLTPKDRGILLSTLINDLGHSDYDVSDEDVARRVRDTEEGLVEDISHEELVSGLKFIPKS